MKLTPLDIRHKEFRRAMRGYSDEEVDVFLDEVADEFERLFQENIEAEERIHRLEQQLAQFEGLKETLQNTLVTAQQQADEMRANARKEAELILRDAELKSRDIVSESYAEKQRVQQALIQLKQIEEDFRFKFRSLLEAHLNLLAEDEASDERRRFRGLVANVEQQLDAGTPPGESSGVAESASAIPAGAFSLAGGAAEPAPPGESAETPPEGWMTDTAPTPSAAAPRLAEDESGEHEPVEAYPQAETKKDSAVRRLLFGKRQEKESSGDFFKDDKEDRDFQW